MNIKDRIREVLESSSEAFGKLKEIHSWSPVSILGNLGIIVQAVKDGLGALEGLRDVAGDIVHDSEAQDQLADILDDAIKLNAVLEMMDGLIFRIIIKAVCTAVSPYIGNPESSPKEVTA